MIRALLMSAALSGAGANAPAEADALIAQATEWLLAGEDLPVDMDLRLRRLPPEERIRVLVFLRRSGMFTGPDWPIDKLLAPALAEPAPPPQTGDAR
ncbi:hypothetical protein GL279_18365 [Paracoccus limosus]|uniref:Uncharacterized protein n=1 Tax=Paracoccus limosus TaxID=913252 RepID=A0A844H9D0_9RHOB|nr:hypothetical protein [Paracoccus limosus]